MNKDKVLSLIDDLLNLIEPTEVNASESDVMSDEEVKAEVINILTDMRSNTSQWAMRDKLKHFTSWGFWTKGEMASLDEPTARELVVKLTDYLKSLKPGSPDIDEAYLLLG